MKKNKKDKKVTFSILELGYMPDKVDKETIKRFNSVLLDKFKQAEDEIKEIDSRLRNCLVVEKITKEDVLKMVQTGLDLYSKDQYEGKILELRRLNNWRSDLTVIFAFLHQVFLTKSDDADLRQLNGWYLELVSQPLDILLSDLDKLK